MTSKEREDARERCEKATAGPWSACTGSGRCECTAVRSDARAGIICDLLPDYELNRDSHKPILDDLRFIESARTDLPAALKQIDDDEKLMRQLFADLNEADLRMTRLGLCDLAATVRAALRARLSGAVCESCRHYSPGCGSRDKDGICKNPLFPQPRTRDGVAEGIWRHVCKNDGCSKHDRARLGEG